MLRLKVLLVCTYTFYLCFFAICGVIYMLPGAYLKCEVYYKY